MDPIATAIVGVSGFGRIHYQDLIDGSQRGVLRPVAACVINQAEEPERCARLRELGAVLYDDLGELLAGHGAELELVQLPTGIPLHRSMTEAVLATDTNVFVEKPVAGSLADAQAMLAARDAAGKLVAVGFQRMFDPAVWALKQALLEGRIGRIERITGYGLWPRARSYYERNGWAGRLRIGDGVPVLDSPIQNAMAHYVMLLLFFGGTGLAAPAVLGEVEAELYRANEIEGPDTCAVRATTAAGLRLSFCASHCCPENDGPVLRIHGSEGSAEWRCGGDVEHGSLRRQDGISERFEGLPQARLRPLIIDQLAAAIRGGPARICTLDQAAVHTALIDAVHSAAEVEPIDSAFWHDDRSGASPLRVIDGIQDLLQSHLEDGRLPSERGVPWARSPGCSTLA
jgi:predicted dehydrogenase